MLATRDKTEIQKEAARLGFKDGDDYLLHLHKQHLAGSVSEKIAEPPKRVGRPQFRTKLGRIYHCNSVDLLRSKRNLPDESVDLIMTSPPFGLVRKKVYGNEDADQYADWFEQFAQQFVRVLKPSGSLVIDLGGAWKKGLPTRSLYHCELLLMLSKKFGFHLAQEFFWWNPAKLPTPAEWVGIRRVRVKDAINYIWWLSKTPYPKTSNRRVLQPYSESMKTLLVKGYKPKLRPSGHDISDKFQRDNGGAIPPNLIALANTESNSHYQTYCRENNLPEHPARFPAPIPAFFIHMLTDPGDLVIDPFAGSCMTGYVAEVLSRRWICSELIEDYVKGAQARFQNKSSGSVHELLGLNRDHPYEVFPPTLLGLGDNLPLVSDGGKHRPKKTAM